MGDNDTKDMESLVFGSEDSGMEVVPPENTPNEIKSLQAKIKTLQENLHDAQNFIFSLQPRHPTLTEAEAIAQFASLTAAVEEWVDQKLGNSLEEMAIASQYRAKDIQNLMDLITAPGKQAFRIPKTDVENIQATILKFLTDNLFHQEFYCPVGKGERDFVHSVERAMGGLRPRRDLRTIRTWHIETYTALSSRPGFAEHANERMRDLTLDITALLLVFAPAVDHETLAKTFFESIMNPAAELARKMHLSFDEFTLQWSPYHETSLSSSGPDLGLGGGDYDFIDLSSGKMLKKGELGVGKWMWVFDLAPKLVVRTLRADSWGEERTLVRPRVLVSVQKSGSKEDDGGKLLESKVTPNPTVLGWLERHLQAHYEQKSQRSSGRFWSSKGHG